MARVCRDLICLLLLLAGPVLAQEPRLPPVDTARVVELSLTDSSTVRGRVIAEDLTSLTLVTSAGVRVTVPLVSLVRWQYAPETPEPPQRGTWRRDPSDARLFLAHTARSLPKGKFSVVDYLVFFPVASYGLTDRVSLTGGMSLVPFSPDQIFYVAPKVTVMESRYASFATGLLYLRVVGFVPAPGYAGIAYGVTTIGDSATSATALAGFPFASGGWERRPLLVLGGERRVSRRIKLMAEGWSIPGTNDVPAVGGFRLIGDHVSWDFGLLFLFGEKSTEGAFLPWVSVTFHW